MQVYLSVDMEGIAGVVHVDQTRRTGYDYEKARRWMTSEANAAASGAFDAGATAVLRPVRLARRAILAAERDPRPGSARARPPSSAGRLRLARARACPP